MIRIVLLTVLLWPPLTAAPGTDASAARSRPNILLIVSEDNAPELGCYGDPYARTPNLDRLAAAGVRFNRAYVAQAGCSQSRASVLPMRGSTTRRRKSATRSRSTGTSTFSSRRAIWPRSTPN
jgi:hypothetical protein